MKAMGKKNQNQKQPKPKCTYLVTYPAGTSREVVEVVKVRRSALRSKPTAQQLFGPKEQRHRPRDMTPTWSTDPCTPCHWCPMAPGCPGGAQGRMDLPPHPDPNCPATLLLCMHHGGETALVSWLWLGALWLWLWLCRAGVALLHLLISCKQPLRAINNSTG